MVGRYIRPFSAVAMMVAVVVAVVAVVVAVMLATMVVVMGVAMVVVVDGWGYNDNWGDVVLDADSMVELTL